MKNFTTASLRIFLCCVLFFVIQKDSFAILYSINSSMSGANEIPAVAGGSGTFTGSYNSVTKIITYTISFNVVGTITAGHYHGPATVTQNAGVVQGFIGLPTGVSTGSFTNSSAALNATQEGQLLGGLFYANLHTNVFPGGAVRGQLLPVALYIMDLTYIVEGLYNSVSDSMVRDTVIVNLRSTSSPFAIISSSKVYLSAAGNASVRFTNAVNSTNYYVQILHRNAIEEYNGQPFNFVSNAGAYDFTSAVSKSYGDNLTLVGTRYCSYSGDVNQNGFIDLSDIIDVSNSTDAFLTGYVPTDLNGDLSVTLEDLLICYNNAIKFISAKIPS